MERTPAADHPFKKGDIVVALVNGKSAGNHYTAGKEFKVTLPHSSCGYHWVDVISTDGTEHVGGTHASHFELKANKTIMSSIKSFIKSVTRTEPEKSFVKAGFIDENENLTEKGREALEFVLWDANKDAVKAIADQVIAAEEIK